MGPLTLGLGGTTFGSGGSFSSGPPSFLRITDSPIEFLLLSGGADRLII